MSSEKWPVISGQWPVVRRQKSPIEGSGQVRERLGTKGGYFVNEDINPLSIRPISLVRFSISEHPVWLK